jgi:hypothetical protein
MVRWLHLPQEMEVSKFRTTIVVSQESHPTFKNQYQDPWKQEKSKTIQSKNEAGKPKHTTFHNGQDDYSKDSAAFVKSL